MKHTAILILAGALLTSPAAAQNWGSDYNMGSIGVLGGTEADGTISIDCAEAGNAVVPQGALSIFLNPAQDVEIDSASVGDLVFAVDGTEVTLPVADNGGDGFVFDKTSASLPQAQQLLDLLETGDELVVTAGGTELARIGLQGAGEALDGVEVCLTP